MNLDQLQREIEFEEGVILEVYLDHLKLPTVGCGHLILKDDPEYGCEVGTAITQERSDELFKKDIQVTLDDCKKIYPDWDDMVEEVKLVCANMCFQLGYNRYSGFKKTIQHIKDKNYSEAAEEMQRSKWYTQTQNRANRLIERMKNVTT
jgi:GH24 family phage-related lysozyme (muramidase)